MTDKQPIKRHTALQPLSREHHQGLLLCWKIREGFRRKVSPLRMKRYADWFWEQHLKPHFETEESRIFPLLPAGHALVRKALADHRRLKRLFGNDNNHIRTLNRIEEELERHIRFEERQLFREIQRTVPPEALGALDLLHRDLPEESWEDEFWHA
jgi:hemerythrin-like domain-containing protein